MAVMAVFDSHGDNDEPAGRWILDLPPGMCGAAHVVTR